MQFQTAVPAVLTLLTVLSQIGLGFYVLLTLLSRFFGPADRFHKRLTAAIARNARVLALTVVLTATSGSLFYSEVLKYNPCLLCWYQRIFMYPQTVLLGLGILKNDRHVADYSLAFSLIGGIIAAFHYWGQVSASSILPCPVVGFSASCSQRFSLEYGYITIPMMSLTAFTLIGALMVIYRLRKSR